MKRLPAFLAALGLAAAASAQPAPTMAQADTAKAVAPKAHFLASADLDLTALLPAPPAPDSPATRAELDAVFALQAARTPAQAARCRQIEGEDIFLFGSEVLGEWFTAANLPQTAQFFTAVREDFGPINRAAKAVWPRRRPPFADARIKPCVDFTDTGAYPSGHGIQSALWAGLLAEIFPDQAAGFRQRAEETLRYKLLSGVHYASDLAAGRVVGEAMARELLKNPAVRKILGQLRAEATPHRRKKAA
ncbi:MAG: phosphatase PAP2 family protein [bacterium]|nr:phosphatase PAP2 family protein [bacterium]